MDSSCNTAAVESITIVDDLVVRGEESLQIVKQSSIYRISVIVAMSLRFFMQIYWFGRKHRGVWDEITKQKWEELLTRQATVYRKTALELEGLLIKLGQFLSARADILPQSFIKELEQLVDQVPHVNWEAAKQVLEEEWKSPYSEYLHKVSLKPVASASIGEVYHGYLHDGSSVAVKIRRPGIEKIIQTDFKAIKIVTWFLARFSSLGKKADLPALYKQMIAVIGDELDFRKELQNGLYFKKRFEDDPFLYVPIYYTEYSTQRVLVMEWIEGAKVTDVDFLHQHAIDRKKLASSLFRCFAEQLFFGGKFHADPHPGNLLVRSDGTLVLIDFGMVGTVQDQDALYIRSVIEAIVIGDYVQVTHQLENLKFLLPSADKMELARVIQLVVELYSGQNSAQMDPAWVERILEDVQGLMKTQPIQLPSEFAFLGRAISTFMGVLHHVDPKADVLGLGKEVVNLWMQKKSEDTEVSPLDFLKSWAKPLLHLPLLLERYLQGPQQNLEWQKLKFQFQSQNDFIMNQKKYTFILFIVSLIALGTGYTLHVLALVVGGGIPTGLCFLRYLVLEGRHKKLVIQIRESR